MAKKLLSCQRFVEAVQDKLSPIYGEPSDFEVGKNKIYFNVAGLTVKLDKSREKSTNERKTIIETEDMYPCVINHDIALNDHKYLESDVNRAVHAIDEYLMYKIGKNYKSAVCADYSMLKYALLPLFIGDTSDDKLVAETQELILHLMAANAEDVDTSLSYLEYEEEKKKFAYFFPFIAKNIHDDKADTCILIMSDVETLTLFKVKLIDGKFSSKENDCTCYEIDINSQQGIQLTAAVKKILREFYDFELCSGRFEKILPEKTKEEVEDEKELIRQLVANPIVI